MCALLLIFFSFGFAQEPTNRLGVSITQHYGFISPHNVLVNEIIKGHTFATELSLYNHSVGNRQWELYYNYPKVGVSALLLNFGNPKSLGNAFGIFPYINFPLNHGKVKLNLKFGYGIGYIEKPFDRVNNYKNLVIGSHLNALIYINSQAEFPVSDKLKFTTGVSFTHFSNGSLKRPNLGINIVALNVGINYSFGNNSINNENTISDRSKEVQHLLLATFGIKEIDPIGGEKYPIYNISYNSFKVVTNKSKLGVGLDLSYNSSLEPLTIRLLNQDKGKISNFNVGVSGIYSLDIGKISLLFHTGAYIYRTYTLDNIVYSRIGTRYQINQKLFLNLSLKTHFFVADFIEYGIGYRLN